MKQISVLILILIAMFLNTGCAKKPKIIAGPPLELSTRIDTDRLRELINSPEIQLVQNLDYYLGPGDIISLQLIGRPDVIPGNQADGGTEFILTDNPLISLPLIGAIRVHGKTVSELQDDLKIAYSDYIVDPQPIVLVKFFNRNKIAVLGSVVSAGKYNFEFGDTALDALFKAGGLSTGGRGGGLAPGRYMKIYRERITGEQRATMSLDEMIKLITSDDGQVIPRDEIVIPIDEFIFNGVLAYNVPLVQNDIIYIPPAGTVMVQGRVNSPGVAFLGPSVSTLTQVLVERGGLRFSADSTVEIVRTYEDGQLASYFINAREIFARESRDFTIQDGDQIFVYVNIPRAIGETIGNMFSGSIRAGANATYNPVGP